MSAKKSKLKVELLTLCPRGTEPQVLHIVFTAEKPGAGRYPLRVEGLA